MASILFDSKLVEGRQAIVVSFDICRFSDFCNHPETHPFIQRFIAALFSEVDSRFKGLLEKFLTGAEPASGRVSKPDHMKFTGDGALMLWFLPDNAESRATLCTTVVSAMRHLQAQLHASIPKWEIDWHAPPLPKRIRFGVAAGQVYPLRPVSDVILECEPEEYVGYCMNLAVRLQDHCPEVGFLIHARVMPRLPGLFPLMAIGIKGTLSEPVFVFVDDFNVTLERYNERFTALKPELSHFADASQSYSLLAGMSPFIAPRFEAHLIGPGKRGQVMFFDQPFPEFGYVVEVKVEQGKIQEEQRVYRLASKGPPLIYQYAQSKSVPRQSGSVSLG
jgi:class 3 adenylate cyclase